MNHQKACEITEALIERETHSKTPALSMTEFLALNVLLLEAAANGHYEMEERYESQ